MAVNLSSHYYPLFCWQQDPGADTDLFKVHTITADTDSLVNVMGEHMQVLCTLTTLHFVTLVIHLLSVLYFNRIWSPVPSTLLSPLPRSPFLRSVLTTLMKI